MQQSSAKRPYESPKLLAYGDLKELTRGNTGPGNDGNGSGLGTKQPSQPCWIAEVLYGVDDPRTHLLRAWLTTMYAHTTVGAAVTGLYGKLGRQVAALAKDKASLRFVLRPLFDAGLRRAQRQFWAAGKSAN